MVRAEKINEFIILSTSLLARIKRRKNQPPMSRIFADEEKEKNRNQD
jgi:hypothetical protein